MALGGERSSVGSQSRRLGAMGNGGAMLENEAGGTTVFHLIRQRMKCRAASQSFQRIIVRPIQRLACAVTHRSMEYQIDSTHSNLTKKPVCNGVDGVLAT